MLQKYEKSLLEETFSHFFFADETIEKTSVTNQNVMSSYFCYLCMQKKRINRNRQ